MAHILPMPRSVLQHHASVTSVMAVADLVAKHRYGVPACALPIEQRELVLAFLERLWLELDSLPKGQAS